MESNAVAEILELNTEDLIKAAIENGEGVIASNGALSLETGARTGRSPKDRDRRRGRARQITARR